MAVAPDPTLAFTKENMMLERIFCRWENWCWFVSCCLLYSSLSHLNFEYLSFLSWNKNAKSFVSFPSFSCMLAYYVRINVFLPRWSRPYLFSNSVHWRSCYIFVMREKLGDLHKHLDRVIYNTVNWDISFLARISSMREYLVS